MASKVVRTLLVLGLLALSSACTVWDYELGLPLAGAETVAASGTPLKDILERLGPPLRVSALDGGFVLGWEYWQVRDSSLGFSLGAAGADILSVDVGAVLIAGEFLVLSFDTGRRLTGGSFARWDSSAGSGAALQPLVGLATLTDVDDLVETLPQHEWGAAWLRRLPEALNTPSRPDMGESGIQQRGTPRGIGQQTLEMND